MSISTTLRRRGSVLRAGAVALVAAVALAGCSVFDLPLPGGANPGSNPLKVHILFRDVLDLVPQTTVKVNDVSVGKVTAINLKHDVADVTVLLPRSTKLPANAEATIRQTSLLGEKFVSLKPPADPSAASLTNGAVIGLDRTGRNPEVEEVLGALGALLSGGGVGQLKIITEELNKATTGREQDVRSVVDQLNAFVGQLAQNKDQIVAAITNLDNLAIQVRQQDASIKLALDNLPAGLAAIDKQRADLVKMLDALNKLSGVGTQVIAASKDATISSFQDLVPILSNFAAAGDNFPKTLGQFLTYPFPDSLIGTTPDSARKFQMGDYMNLSVHLDANLLNTALPGLPGQTLGGVLQTCNTTPLAPVCQQAAPIVNTLCNAGGLLASTPLCTPPGAQPSTTGGTTGGTTGSTTGGTTGSTTGGTTGSTTGSTTGGTTGQTCIVPGVCLPRTAFDQQAGQATTSADPYGFSAYGIDPNMGSLLFEGAL